MSRPPRRATPLPAKQCCHDCAVQVGVFSATLPPEALDITRKFMSKPVRILVKRDELTLEGIKQVRRWRWRSGGGGGVLMVW